MHIIFRPTLRQRRLNLMCAGCYGIAFAMHLWAPVRSFPAGLYPFGREPGQHPGAC